MEKAQSQQQPFSGVTNGCETSKRVYSQDTSSASGCGVLSNGASSHHVPSKDSCNRMPLPFCDVLAAPGPAPWGGETHGRNTSILATHARRRSCTWRTSPRGTARAAPAAHAILTRLTTGEAEFLTVRLYVAPRKSSNLRVALFRALKSTVLSNVSEPRYFRACLR